jgi:hypothetical protein
MIARRSSAAKVALLAVLVAMGSWEVYMGGEALAQLVVFQTHYRCFVITPAGPPVKQTVSLTDAFGTDVVTVQTSHYLCTPTTKVHNGTMFVPVAGATDLKCYHIRPTTRALKDDVLLSDQFRQDDRVTVITPHLLCAPAERADVPDDGVD